MQLETRLLNWTGACLQVIKNEWKPEDWIMDFNERRNDSAGW